MTQSSRTPRLEVMRVYHMRMEVMYKVRWYACRSDEVVEKHQINIQEGLASGYKADSPSVIKAVRYFPRQTTALTPTRINDTFIDRPYYYSIF